MYLLDTNCWIAFLNPGESPVVARMREQEETDLYLCSVVQAELLFGAYHSSRVKDNLRLLQTIFGMYPTLPFDDAAADHYGQIRAHLEQTGKLVGANDMLIAAIGRSKGLIVVTNNVSEFSYVPGLRIEDWNTGG
jgi:tRNA(fMet)-specific endonuclease VapC